MGSMFRGSSLEDYYPWYGAEGESRTRTPLRAHGPEPCASAIPPLRRNDISISNRPYDVKVYQQKMAGLGENIA